MSSAKRRRWWLRGLLIGTLLVANMGVAYAVLKVDSVEDAIIESVDTVPDLGPVLDVAPDEPSEPLTVLVIGSDSRENLPDEWEDDFGVFGGARADVIMLVNVLPETGEIRIVSVPRDLLVDIDGFGPNKVNAAYALGGAQLMVKTLRAEFGVAIHHYVEIDFVGFAGLVDELGGVGLDFAYPARDLKSGLAVEAGSQTLDGRMALAYARSRSYQEFRDGAWTNSEANDIGRTSRQQDLVLAMFEVLKSPTVLAGAEELVESVGGYVAVDAALLQRDLFSLAFDFRNVSGDSIESGTLPTVSEKIDGVWYELLVEPGSSELLDSFRSASAGSGTPLAATTTTVGAGSFDVVVINAGGLSGVASQTATALSENGYVVIRVDNATTFGAPETLVQVPAGAEAVGADILSVLGLGTMETVPGANEIVVRVGQDVGGA